MKTNKQKMKTKDKKYEGTDKLVDNKTDEEEKVDKAEDEEEKKRQ